MLDVMAENIVAHVLLELHSYDDTWNIKNPICHSNNCLIIHPISF